MPLYGTQSDNIPYQSVDPSASPLELSFLSTLTSWRADELPQDVVAALDGLGCKRLRRNVLRQSAGTLILLAVLRGSSLENVNNVLVEIPAGATYYDSAKRIAKRLTERVAKPADWHLRCGPSIIMAVFVIESSPSGADARAASEQFGAGIPVTLYLEKPSAKAESPRTFMAKLGVNTTDRSRETRIAECSPEELMFCASLLRFCPTLGVHGDAPTPHHAPFTNSKLEELLKMPSVDLLLRSDWSQIGNQEEQAKQKFMLLEEVVVARYLAGRLASPNPVGNDAIRALYSMNRTEPGQVLSWLERQVNADKDETTDPPTYHPVSATAQRVIPHLRNIHSQWRNGQLDDLLDPSLYTLNLLLGPKVLDKPEDMALLRLPSIRLDLAVGTGVADSGSAAESDSDDNRIHTQREQSAKQRTKLILSALAGALFWSVHLSHAEMRYAAMNTRESTAAEMWGNFAATAPYKALRTMCAAIVGDNAFATGATAALAVGIYTIGGPYALVAQYATAVFEWSVGGFLFYWIARGLREALSLGLWVSGYSIQFMQAAYELRLKALAFATKSTKRAIPDEALPLCSVSVLEASVVETYRLAVEASKEASNQGAGGWENDHGQLSRIYRRHVRPNLSVSGGESDMTQFNTIDFLRFVSAINVLRTELPALTLIPVMGLQNCGKSTLIKSLTQVDTVPGLRNTLIPGMVPVWFDPPEDTDAAPSSPDVILLDFPASNDGRSVFVGTGRVISGLSAGSIVVLDLKDSHTESATELVGQVATARNAPERVLVFLNKVDAFWTTHFADAKEELEKKAVETQGVEAVSKGFGPKLTTMGGPKRPKKRTDPQMRAEIRKKAKQLADDYVLHYARDAIERLSRACQQSQGIKTDLKFQLSVLTYADNDDLASIAEDEYGDSAEREAARSVQLAVDSLNSALATAPYEHFAGHLHTRDRVAFAGDVKEWILETHRIWQEPHAHQ